MILFTVQYILTHVLSICEHVQMTTLDLIRLQSVCIYKEKRNQNSIGTFICIILKTNTA